jgi:hypothetical protein
MIHITSEVVTFLLLQFQLGACLKSAILSKSHIFILFILCAVFIPAPPTFGRNLERVHNEMRAFSVFPSTLSNTISLLSYKFPLPIVLSTSVTTSVFLTPHNRPLSSMRRDKCDVRLLELSPLRFLVIIESGGRSKRLCRIVTTLTMIDHINFLTTPGSYILLVCGDSAVSDTVLERVGGLRVRTGVWNTIFALLFCH